jgi:hypothetical protein
MQYKIPIQIENEDVIVAGLSIRQLIIIMVWWGIGYAIFKSTETRISPMAGLFLAAPFVFIGIIVALMRIAEMTFLPIALNFFRLSLNSKSRIWSQGTDGYSEVDIWYVIPNMQKANAEANKSLESKMSDEASDKILKL